MSPALNGTLWKMVGVSGTIFFAGAATAGWIGLPKRMVVIEAQVEQMQAEHRVVRQAIDRIEMFEKAQLCLQIAERAHKDWRSCASTLQGATLP